MNNTRQIIYLAGLLHDIGKFYQRADKGFSDKAAELSEYSKNIANDICPLNDKGRFGYQHVVWTNEFFERFKEKLNTIPGIKENLFSENSGENNIVSLACNHHLPKTELQAIVTLADWWSAGIDRRSPETFEKEEEASGKIKWGKTRYKNIPLYSIFNTLNKGDFQNGFGLNSLTIEKDSVIFPKEINEANDGNSEKEYQKLWKEFEKEFEKLPTDSIEGFTESLLYLLKKYTWCIPSNTMDMANVSLFEHLKTTAAFADCLYEYYRVNENDFNWNNSDRRLTIAASKHPVLLVGGDISGIQKFIYNIASRKAATSLKGRSFYLQLLIDSIIQKIISHEAIQATIGHVVYSSGGKFFMLLPNTEKVNDALEEIRYLIEQELWADHKGKLIFNLDVVPFAYIKNSVVFPGNEDNNLGGLWKTLADKLTNQKNRKFNNHLLNNYEEFFKIIPSGGDVKVCAVTGIELKKGEFKEIKSADTNTFVSEAVIEQIKLGTVLKDADFAITYKGKEEDSSYLSNRSKHPTTIVGIANYLFDQAELTKDDADFRNITSADVSRVKMINKTNFLDAPLKGHKVSYGFQFYGGNKQALNFHQSNKTFEELTEIRPGDEKSESYFGVLRMDVDGLGDIFIKGIEEKNKSFAAYSTLSFQLDLFFSGYLNTIREKYAEHVNILYSGGDDIFAVGKWDKIIAFAEDIRKEFKRFTGRDDISISAGITIVNNKFPIAKAAELAGEAEHNAKTNEVNGKKNAICFLGETVSWNEEFAYVKLIKNDFFTLIEKDKMSKGILHRIMLFADIKKTNERKSKADKTFKPELKYKWNTVYYLKRFMDRYDKNENIKFFIKKLQIELFTGTGRNYDLISLAARWAELELKELK